MPLNMEGDWSWGGSLPHGDPDVVETYDSRSQIPGSYQYTTLTEKHF